MSCVMGIDPSLNSTGICINQDGQYKYKLLATKPTKKFVKATENIPSVDIIILNKEPNVKGVEGEINKTRNVAYIIHYVNFFLDLYRPDYVTIEAPAFSASGRVADLAGLNYAIRLACYDRHIPCYPIAPTSVKMQAVGNGHATKEMMIETWLHLFPEYESIKKEKIDDLADAWALCEYENTI